MKVAFLLLALTATAHADEVSEKVADGDAHAAAGNAAAAIADYQKALALDPDRLAIYDKAIPLWIAAEDWADARAWLEKATLRQPRYAAGWYALGYVYRRTGHVAAAVGAYQEYTELRPDDAAGWFGLGVSDELADDRAPAVAAYRRYVGLERDPARASYVQQARGAIERLSPVPATWADAVDAIVTGRATLAVWATFVTRSGA